MKFCYLDESGIGDEPIGIMVGIITDSIRMHPTKKDWIELLSELSNITGRTITEIHTRDLYRGNTPWRGLNGQQRSDIIDGILKWLQDRKHSLVYSIVDKTKFNQDFSKEAEYSDIVNIWRFMAFHVTLAIQRAHQKYSKNKGHTLLIFDREVREQKEFTNLILNPPTWSDSYYGKKKKQDRLDQIIDVPHFVDSTQVALIQLADFIAYFLRHHFELQLGLTNEKYNGEKDKIAIWANLGLNMSIPKSNMYLSKGRCPASELFCKYAPTII